MGKTEDPILGISTLNNIKNKNYNMIYKVDFLKDMLCFKLKLNSYDINKIYFRVVWKNTVNQIF